MSLKYSRKMNLGLLLIIGAIVIGLVVYEFERKGPRPPQQVSDPAAIDSSLTRTVDLNDLDENSGVVRAELPYFHRLSPSFMRGGEPASGGVELLARMGVKTIIDFRTKFERNDRVSREAERLGLNYFWIPLSVWDPPDDDVIDRFLAVVNNPANAPVFVFCADGLNRTGVMSALYRIVHDGYSIDRAVKEMDDLGFNAFYYALRTEVWEYPRTLQQRDARSTTPLVKPIKPEKASAPEG